MTKTPSWKKPKEEFDRLCENVELLHGVPVDLPKELVDELWSFITSNFIAKEEVSDTSHTSINDTRINNSNYGGSATIKPISEREEHIGESNDMIKRPIEPIERTVDTSDFDNLMRVFNKIDEVIKAVNSLIKAN